MMNNDTSNHDDHLDKNELMEKNRHELWKRISKLDIKKKEFIQRRLEKDSVREWFNKQLHNYPFIVKQQQQLLLEKTNQSRKQSFVDQL